MTDRQYEDALKKYTKVFASILELKSNHKELFDQAEQLELERVEAETYLKRTAAQANEGIENKLLKVKVTPAFRKYFDYSVILKIARPQELAIINEKAIATEIDRIIFEDLVETGKIRPELKQKSFREVALTPRVSITMKGMEDEKA